MPGPIASGPANALPLERRSTDVVAWGVNSSQRCASCSHGLCPPPLGLHLLMGPVDPTKIGNMITAMTSGIVAPVELVCRRP